MSARFVTRTGKGPGDAVRLLCLPGAEWSPKTKEAAIKQIEAGTHTYWATLAGVGSAEIVIVCEDGVKNLYARHGRTHRNFLLELPNC